MRGASDVGQDGCVVGKRVADVVKAERVRQPGVEKADDVTPGRKLPGVDFVFGRQAVYKMPRN